MTKTIGYVRRISGESDRDYAQALSRAKLSQCDQIFEDSNADGAQLEFDKAFTELASGDKLVVYKLSHLGHAGSVEGVFKIVYSIRQKGIILLIISAGTDGELDINDNNFSMFKTICDASASMHAENIQEGLEKAKVNGALGRKKKYGQKELDQALQMLSEGLSKKNIAITLGMTRATLDKLLSQ
jgi:DNA invertase Pin-like site-specific DNA recombinase